MAESVDDFIAGWASGAAAVIATQPLDMVITRLQSTSAKVAAPASLSALWRGVTPLVLGQPINNALMFIGYGAGTRMAERSGVSPDNLVPIFVAGCIGGFAQSFIQSPVELLKVRLQLAEAGAGASARVSMREVLAELAPGGLSAAIPPLLSRGLGATLWRDVLPHGVWFASYDLAKAKLRPEGASKDAPLSVPSQLSAGAFAATAAWLVGYPFDVLKTRCQMAGGEVTLSAAASTLHAEGGIGAFYRGLVLKLCRAIPMSAIGFMTYEYGIRELGRLRGTADRV